MIAPGRPELVVLGMMTKMPVAGVVWQNLHYLLGFRRLGYEVYYVESHARVPSMLMHDESEDSGALAAAFIDSMLRPFDLSRNWAYVALHDDSCCYGLSRQRLRRLLRSASMIINLHGGTVITPELAATGRLVYLETDPVQLQIELAGDLAETKEFLEPHSAFFTFAECLGSERCSLPVSEEYRFHPTRQPVVCDLWRTEAPPTHPYFTTIGNWQQEWRDVTFGGKTYTWSKADEFKKLIELPRRTSAGLELALSSCRPDDRDLLERHGWSVRPGMSVSTDPVSYRRYVRESVGEFTVAKDQNVRFGTGWFSDRSATYLAAGRPVITQDTGFGDVLPVGSGLFAFHDLEDAAQALEAVVADYPRHSRAAAALAAELFDSGAVLARLVDTVGESVPRPPRGGATPSGSPFPDSLDIEPTSRWPTVLSPETIEAVLASPWPEPEKLPSRAPGASIVIPTRDNLVFLRLCLEHILADPSASGWEVVVVDNGSRDGTVDYLREVGRRRPRVRVLELSENRGFAAAINAGIAAASADRLVLLNDDAIPPHGSLRRLLGHLEEPRIGLAGPCTNRSGDEAEVPHSYRTCGGLARFSRDFRSTALPQPIEVDTITLFCTAVRRDVIEQCGPLDERFGVGLFEDDDYSMRVRECGYDVVIAGDVFVHHFGQGTIGKLAATDEYGDLFRANQARFERKWQSEWHPHRRRFDPAYDRLVQRVHERIAQVTAPGAVVAIVSSGDDVLASPRDAEGRHFPADAAGCYTGFHPADSQAALAALDQARAAGAGYLVVPRTSFWWLDHYGEFARVLSSAFPVLCSETDTCLIFDLDAEMNGLRSAEAGLAGAGTPSKGSP